jgi:hypothetical protein
VPAFSDVWEIDSDVVSDICVSSSYLGNACVKDTNYAPKVSPIPELHPISLLFYADKYIKRRYTSEPASNTFVYAEYLLQLSQSMERQSDLVDS